MCEPTMYVYTKICYCIDHQCTNINSQDLIYNKIICMRDNNVLRIYRF